MNCLPKKTRERIVNEHTAMNYTSASDYQFWSWMLNHFD